MLKPIPNVTLLKTFLNARNLFNNPIGVIDAYFEKFKTDSFRTPMGPKDIVLLSKNPKLAKHILQKNHKNYHKSKIQSEILARFIGKGLLTSNGNYWLKQRRLIQPGFHKKNLNSFLQIMHHEIQAYIAEFSIRHPKKAHTVDISTEMSKITMRVVSRALFSSQVEEAEIEFIGKSVDALQIALSKDIRLPFLSWWRQLSGEEKKNNKLAKKLYDLICDKINERKRSGPVDGDLLDMLLQVRYEESGEGMSEQQLVDEILVLYAAGYETTANSLAWTLYLLAKNPEHLQRLSKEVDSVNLTGELKMETIFQLPFTTKVTSESLRLFPPVWIIDRLALEEDEIDGIKIRKGEMINIYILGIHRSEKYWKDPHRFDPERFEGEKHIKTDFTYLPFGGGPRLCIGYQFAKLELSLVLHYILKHYKISLPKNQVITMKPMVALKPNIPIKMILTKRN